MYQLLKEQEAQGEEITKENIEEKIKSLTEYKFRNHSIKLLKDDYFGAA